MTTYRRRPFGLHVDVTNRRAREYFIQFCGSAAAPRRAAQIAALPQVKWKGRTLYTIRCSGDFGRGPHLQNVPESLLWQLMDVKVWRCPFHAK